MHSFKSLYPLRPRSCPHLRGVEGMYCRWCTRNRRDGPTPSRATPASAGCVLRSGRPTGSSERLRILCSSLSAPSTVTGINEYRNIMKTIKDILIKRAIQVNLYLLRLLTTNHIEVICTDFNLSWERWSITVSIAAIWSKLLINMTILRIHLSSKNA